MSAQGAAGAGEAVQTTSRESRTENREPRTENTEGQSAEQIQQANTESEQVPQPTLLGALLSEMGVKGKSAEGEEQVGEVSIKEEEPQPTAAATAEGEPEGEVTPPGGEEKSLPADEDKPPPKDWPKEAIAQMMTDRRKRKERTIERDQEHEKRVAAEARAADLEEQLKSAPRVQAMPSAADPLAHVTNENQLRQMVQTYEELLEEAELHPEGMDLPVGKDAEGNVEMQHFDAEATAKVRVQAGRILRHAVPAKFAYLQGLRASEEEARTIHPDLFNPQSQLHKDALAIVQGFPEIMRFPDWMLWIGDAFTARNARLAAAKTAKNGEANGAPAAKNLKIAPLLKKTPPIAPGVPKVGGIRAPAAGTVTEDADVEKATKELREKRGQGDSVENYLAAKLLAAGKGSGGRAPVPI